MGSAESEEGTLVEGLDRWLHNPVSTDHVDRHQVFETIRRRLLGQNNAVRLSRYVLLDWLGSGGAGTVYTAYDPELDRKVAIKLVRLRAGGRRSDSQLRLYREAQALARLSHPNVIPVYDVGRYSGTDFKGLSDHEAERQNGVFIVMELVKGEALNAWLANGHDWRTILRTFIAAGRGLEAAHECDLIHRDFKPGNVLVGEDGRVRVLDFGLARNVRFSELTHPRASEGSDLQPITEDGTQQIAAGSVELMREHPSTTQVDGPGRLLGNSLTESGTVIGTPTYMSPEQHRGDQVTQASDQYNFCFALYEALYRRRPVEGSTLAELREGKEQAIFTAIPRNSPVPGGVHRALLRGLNPDPADRYENIGALLRDLERHTVDNRRRLVFWSAGAAAAMAAGVVGLGAARVDPDLCREGTEKITQVWNSATKESIASSFAAVDTPYATHMWATVERHLGGYAEQWAAMYQDACEATRVHGVQSTELLDRRMACLHERFETFSILTDRLRSADEATVPLAIDAVAALDPVAECDLVSTRGAPALAMGEGDDPSIEAGKREVRTATVERRLGHYETAREAAIRATHIARAAQDRGLEAAAFRALGLAELSRARYEASRDAFEQAVRAALATQQYGEAAVISASLAESLAQLTKLDAAATAIGQAQALAEGIQMTSRDLAFIHAAAGSVLHDQGEYEQALEHQLRAVEFTRGEVPLFASANLYELAFGYYNVGQYNAALETIRETIQLRQELFGPRHPLYGHSLMLLGMILEELEQFEEAERAHEEALDIYLAVYDGPHLNIGLALNNRGNILRKTGRAAAAHELYIRALEIFEQQTNRFMIAMANLNLGTTSLSLERYPQAVEHLSTAIEMTEQDLGVNHRNLAAPLEYLGKTRIAQGRAIEAIAPLERAVAIRLAHIDSTDLSTLANAELLLSEALWTVHREPERAKVLARSARSRLAADVEKYPQRSKRDLEAAQAWLDDLERVVP